MITFTRKGSIILSFTLAVLLDMLLIILAVSRVESQALEVLFWPGEFVAKLIYSGFHSVAPLVFAAAVNCICYALCFFFIIKIVGVTRDS